MIHRTSRDLPRISSPRCLRCPSLTPHAPRRALAQGGFDVVTPHAAETSTGLVVHEPKTMVDLSKAMDNHTFRFDGVFGERATNAQIFDAAVRPMVEHLFNTRGGHGTCFAYGQTGSGKTVTMEGLGGNAQSAGNRSGLYWYVAHAIFDHIEQAARNGEALVVRAGFFEIYRGKCLDLLARKRKIEVMEDERGMQVRTLCPYLPPSMSASFSHLPWHVSPSHCPVPRWAVVG